MTPLPQRGLKIGQKAELRRTAEPAHAIALGGSVPVFSTPAMIDLMEHAARELLDAHLENGEETVGVDVNIAHLAATPIGGEVRAVAELIALDKRTAEFAVSAFDAHKQIGQGSHTRAVINLDKFAAHVSAASDVPKPMSNGTSPTATVGLVAPWSDLEPDTGPLPELKNLSFTTEGKLGLITLERPRARNALDPQTIASFERLVPWLAGHAESIHAVILTGSGAGFCAGSDIKAVSQMSPEAASAFSLRQGRLGNAFAEIPQPVIAAINGYSFGGGCVLAACCDFRLASTAATFSMPEVKLGWPGGWGMSQLVRHIGQANAMELCLTGKSIPARTALEWGLLHKVVPGARLMSEARQLARELLAQPPLALRENKWLMHYLAGPFARETYPQEDAAYIRCLRSADAREGIEAFLQKRPPMFTGR